MKSELLYKNPRLLPFGIVLLTLAIISIPLKNTILLALRYNELQKNISKLKEMPQVSKSKEFHEDLLEDVDHTKKVFEALSVACQTNGIIIKQVDLPKSVDADNVVIESLQISLAGSFVNVLKSLRDITPHLQNVRISSIRFSKEENNKEVSLGAYIVFQSVKQPLDNEK